MPTPAAPRTPRDADFAEECCALLGSVGPCVARRMFGGWGLSVDGLNIALIADGTLYLKAGAEHRDAWLAAGGHPFEYQARGKTQTLQYWTVPDEAMASPGHMAPWARRALDSALKARKPLATPGKDATKKRANPAPPSSSRSAAPPPPASARRRSRQG